MIVISTTTLIVCRYLGTLKGYVRNRSYPEGSIAEGYIADESITHCSRYFEDHVETRFNRPSRNDENLENSSNEEQPFTVIPGRPIGKAENVILDDMTLMQAHRAILYNCDSISPFIE